ncbi:MAG: chromo domain-containing protein [Thaumarchaeota archaeon]|nr:chromo domain-containing protein [Nitrososphaerota archaeon]
MKKGRKTEKSAAENGPSQPTQEEEAEEPSWEVKRLEGMREVDGVLYFKVRWEGDWPPDENPTWEPEENIMKSLVNKYLKKHAASSVRGISSSSNASTMTPGSAPRNAKKQQKQKMIPQFFAKKYIGVQEVFEGDEDILAAAPVTVGLNAQSRNRGRDDGDDGDGEEFRVTEENRVPRMTHKPSVEDKKDEQSRVDSGLARQFTLFNQGKLPY